jgi:hypothetical protein
MARQRRHTPEQIVNKLRQADVELSRGSTIAIACKAIGVTEQTTTAPGARSWTGRMGQ